jgi:hypothetical protein
MTHHTLSAHTDGDDIDPRTVARVLRRALGGLGSTLAVVGLVALSFGLHEEAVELLLIGCTALGCSTVAVGITLTVYLIELVVRGQAAIRTEVHEVAQEQEQQAERLTALEEGERALAGAVRTMNRPPDELGGRRRQS